jgi:hypothetical protein
MAWRYAANRREGASDDPALHQHLSGGCLTALGGTRFPFGFHLQAIFEGLVRLASGAARAVALDQGTDAGELFPTGHGLTRASARRLHLMALG